MLALSLLLLAGCGVSDQPTAQTVPSPTTQLAHTSTPTGLEHDATKASLGVQSENEMTTYAALPSPTFGMLPTSEDLSIVSPTPAGMPPAVAPMPTESVSADTLARTLLLGGSGPIVFTLTDAQGRRLGYDPASPDEFREIPNGQYGIDAEDKPFGSVYDPVAGEATLTIIGTGTGEYRIIGVYGDSTGDAGLFAFDGQITAGAQVTKRVSVPQQASDYPQPPDAQIAMNDTAVVGQPITFAGTFTDGNPNDTHTIVWDFGDGTTADGTLTPTHTYVQPGVYTATLTVTDSAGFTDQEHTQITVELPL